MDTTLFRPIARTSPRAGRSPVAERPALTKVYGHGPAAVRALDGVDVDFESGAFTAIMGPSGSGKSTLMHLLAGLDEATSGEVRLGATELTALDDGALTRLRRDRVGFVFQSFNLLPMFTAEQNILLPLELAGRRGPRVVRHARRRRSGSASGSPTGPASCPAVSSSGWRSPARSSPSPRSCSPTSRPATSTRAPAPRC